MDTQTRCLGQMEPRRAPPAPQKRPSWTSGDQTFSTWAPDEAQQKEPSGRKKYSTPSSDEGAKSIRCRKKNGRRPKNRSGRNALSGLGRLLVLLWRSPFLVALSGLLVLLVCLLPCLRVCWVLPGSGSCLFALFFCVWASKDFQVSPASCLHYVLFIFEQERGLRRTDGAR